MINLLLQYGADPYTVSGGFSAIAMAAREGRSDVLSLVAEKGFAVDLEGIDKLIAACAIAEYDAVGTIIEQSPELLEELKVMGWQLLARFCLCGNVEGTKMLLDLGIDANTPYVTGDGYYGIPEGSLPIHVAAWLHYPAVVKLLIERGSAIDTQDKNGQTPLALAVKACVDSYWTARRSPDAVKALLDAGASPKNVKFPSGYKEVDDLLQA